MILNQLLKQKKIKNTSKFDFFDLENLNTKNDFIKARAETDSSALQKKFSNKEIYKKIYLQIRHVNLYTHLRKK